MSSISVVIPTYNRGHIIKKSIESVINQTIAPIEIIVVDDHSTDNTKEIIESLGGNVKYTLNAFSKGANGARNTGIKLAKGNYIAFQDSDDIWLPTKLQRQLDFMEENKSYDMCFSSLLITNHKRGIVPKRQLSSSEIRQKLLIRNFISTQTIFIKRSVACKHMFDEKLNRQQDWDFCLRISKKNKIHHLNEVLVHVELQEDSITNNADVLEAFEALFKKHPEVIKSCFANTSLNHKILLKKYLKLRNPLLILKHFFYFFNYKLLEKLIEKEGRL